MPPQNSQTHKIVENPLNVAVIITVTLNGLAQPLLDLLVTYAPASFIPGITRYRPASEVHPLSLISDVLVVTRTADSHYADYLSHLLSSANPLVSHGYFICQ